MVEVSWDDRRVYFTTFYQVWDDQFYPDGIKSWMVKLNAGPDGGLTVIPTSSSSLATTGHTRSGWRRRLFIRLYCYP